MQRLLTFTTLAELVRLLLELDTACSLGDNTCCLAFQGRFLPVRRHAVVWTEGILQGVLTGFICSTISLGCTF